MSYCVFITRQFQEGSCLNVFLLLDSLRRVHVLPLKYLYCLQIRERCRKGIPPSLRSRAWQYLCGSKFLMEQNTGRYQVSNK